MRRATMVWCGILVVASINGALRDVLLAPRLGDTIARAISTILLCLAVLAVTWLTIRWIHPESQRAALMVGVWWLMLTLAFEFLVGHYLLRKPWALLLADYDISRGRIWIAVLIVTTLAPWWAAKQQGIVAR